MLLSAPRKSFSTASVTYARLATCQLKASAWGGSFDTRPRPVVSRWDGPENQMVEYQLIRRAASETPSRGDARPDTHLGYQQGGFGPVEPPCLCPLPSASRDYSQLNPSESDASARITAAEQIFCKGSRSVPLARRPLCRLESSYRWLCRDHFPYRPKWWRDSCCSIHCG